MEKTLGENIAPILTEIENALFEHQVENRGQKAKFPPCATSAAIKIFMDVIMERMWEMQSAENMPLQQRCEMVEALGNGIKKLVFTYTGIDTHSLYK